MDQSTTSANPYADGAPVYRTLGWPGVLPADLNGRPGHVPAGFSGGHDADPDDQQVERWRESHATHNVALRLPDGVVGVDVDVYGDKHGDDTIRWFAEQQGCGDLPATWTSTARGPAQPSRIYLYRVPEGLSWRSDLGRGSCVEIIRRGHRWARVWPSTNPRLVGRVGKDVSDATYRWYGPDGALSAAPPRPEALAVLSDGWIAVLRDDGASRPSPGPERAARNYASEDAPALDVDGQPVDPDLILEQGIPIGSQQSELFRYFCSLRARGLRRSEMIALGMIALQRLENDPSREPWSAGDVVELVDHVRREYSPGAAQLPGGMRDFVQRLQAGGGLSVDEPALVEETASDLGNSLRFARLFRERCRYAADVQRWYVWDGRRWAPDGVGRVVDLTKHVIDDLRREAFAADGDDRQRWLQWAHGSEALARRKAMLEGAASEPDLVVTNEVFDADQNLLVVRNGTVDLRSGMLRPSDPADLNSNLAEVDFDPEADCPLWDGHVGLLTAGSVELAWYLARAVGYTLTGDVGARAFFFLEGDGSNGKNAFIEPIMQLMGSYAQAGAPSLLTGDESQHPTAQADLLGARLVFIDETRQGRPLNVERIKALTGSKRVKARFIRKDFFEFEARFKLWIAGNGQPTVRDSSDGVWSRMHRVKCEGKVDAGRRIDRFGDVMYEKEASGILNWALRGLLDWRGRGLAVPASVTADVDEYQHDENYEQQFVEEFCVITGDRNDRLRSADLYRLYAGWCDANGIRGVDKHNLVHFSREVSKLAKKLPGLQRAEWKNGIHKMRGFAGIQWVTPQGM